jgi:hypothetical protein
VSLLLLRTKPSPVLRGRWGVVKRINDRVPKYQKYSKEWWAAVFQDILDHWDD